MLLLAIASFQLGASIAKGMFPLVGSNAVVFLRLAVGGVLLVLLWRPRLRGHAAADYAVIAVFGLILVGMNSAFYAALTRLPLGIAVTVEFVGPLGVAVAASRRRLDLLWAFCATAGIVLLTPVGMDHVDPLGLVLALLAGGLWACYILVAKRVGRAWSGGSGMALAMCVGAILLLPVGVHARSAILHAPSLVLTAVALGLLSTALPFSLEFAALQRMPARIYGILVSLEPAVAALVGFLFLHETLDLRALCAVALVMTASIGSTRSHDPL
jgi:inner membrane transporter RhtA